MMSSPLSLVHAVWRAPALLARAAYQKPSKACALVLRPNPSFQRTPSAPLKSNVKRVHMASRIVPALSRSELASRLDAVFNPREGQFIEGQIDTMLLEFCLNCPDPPAAMDAVIEAPEGVGCEEILDQVLSMPARSPGSYSEEELSADHPLRTWRVQLRVV